MMIIKANCYVIVVFVGLTITSLFVLSPFGQSAINTIREGFAAPTLNLPKGEMKIGDTRVWTKDGMACDLIVYKRNPNEISGSPQLVRVTHVDGSGENADSIESMNHRNYLTLYIAKEKKLFWIPFEAISVVTFKKAEVITLKGAKVEEELYGRFRFYLAPYSSIKLTYYSVITLLYPLADGRKTISGYFLDQQEKLRVFAPEEWRDISWDTLLKITFHWPECRKKVPAFIYRTIGDYKNVWREYTFQASTSPADSAEKPARAAD